MADLYSKDPRITDRIELLGPAADAPHRVTDSNRETGSSWSTPYEAHTVAPEKQLEGSRVPRRVGTDSQVTPPSSQWWLEESNVLQGQPLHPLKHAVQIFTETSKEGWGTQLNECTAKGSWFLP